MPKSMSLEKYDCLPNNTADRNVFLDLCTRFMTNRDSDATEEVLPVSTTHAKTLKTSYVSEMIAFTDMEYRLKYNVCQMKCLICHEVGTWPPFMANPFIFRCNIALCHNCLHDARVAS